MMMLEFVVCPNPACGEPSRWGGDVLGRTFRCRRCGSRLPRKRTANLAPEEPEGEAPWEREAPLAARLLGAARPLEVGRYLVRERLRVESGVTVYRAHDPRLQREVALEVGPVTAIGHDEATPNGLLAEARLLALLDHPGILWVHDVGNEGGRAFLATPLVDRRTLADRLEAGPLVPLEAAEITRDLADALRHAHARGVAHRCLSADHVRLDERGDVCLRGFTTATATLPGSRRRLVELGDQHDLGALFYQMLVGRAPFARGSLRDPDGEDLIAPREFRPAVPRVLEAACLRALAADPADRYPSCGHLAAVLDRWLERARESANALEVMRRASRWVKRIRAAAMSSMFGLSALIALPFLAVRASPPVPGLVIPPPASGGFVGPQIEPLAAPRS